MTQSEDRLREKLRKIEALYAGAATVGEKSAAGAAAERLRRQFQTSSKAEPSLEFKFSVSDPWCRRLLVALCRRYGVKPYRYHRMKAQTVIVRAPNSFVRLTLWPEYEELRQALAAHLDEITDRIIREEVYETTGDAEEIAEPRQLL